MLWLSLSLFFTKLFSFWRSMNIGTASDICTRHTLSMCRHPFFAFLNYRTYEREWEIFVHQHTPAKPIIHYRSNALLSSASCVLEHFRRQAFCCRHRRLLSFILQPNNQHVRDAIVGCVVVLLLSLLLPPSLADATAFAGENYIFPENNRIFFSIHSFRFSRSFSFLVTSLTSSPPHASIFQRTANEIRRYNNDGAMP